MHGGSVSQPLIIFSLHIATARFIIQQALGHVGGCQLCVSTRISGSAAQVRQPRSRLSNDHRVDFCYCRQTAFRYNLFLTVQVRNGEAWVHRCRRLCPAPVVARLMGVKDQNQGMALNCSVLKTHRKEGRTNKGCLNDIWPSKQDRTVGERLHGLSTVSVSMADQQY